MTNRKYSCLICKRLSDKDHKKGLVGNYLLSSMFWFDSRKEIIEHIKRVHQRIYNKEFKKEENLKK